MTSSVSRSASVTDERECTEDLNTLANLNDLRKRGIYCDVTLCVGGTEIPAHRNVLHVFSPYFRLMFEKGSGKVIKLHSLEVSAVQLLLEFAYTGKIVITEENASSLLLAAHILEVISVKNACGSFLQEHLRVETCIAINSIAEQTDSDEMYERSMEYILAKFSDVAEDETFLSLSTEKLLRILSSDDLVVQDECLVFEAALRWYMHAKDERHEDLRNVLENVRFPFMSPSYIFDVVECHPVNQEFKVLVQRLILEANRYQMMPERRAEIQTSRTRVRKNNLKTKHNVIMVINKSSGEVLSYTPETYTWADLTLVPDKRLGGLTVTERNVVYTSIDKTIWRYDPLRNTFQQLPSTNVSRRCAGLGTIGENVYVVGGCDTNSKWMSSVERFSALQETWEMVASTDDILYYVKVDSYDGYLYAVGTDTYMHYVIVQQYCPVSNMWTVIGKKERESFCTSCLANGKIYIFGCSNSTNVDYYDIKEKVWCACEPMLTPRSHPGVTVFNNNIYVFGGGRKSIEFFDQLTDTWTEIADMRCPDKNVVCVGIQILKRDSSIQTKV